MRYLSLFSGIGGFELGIQQAYDMGIESTIETGESSKPDEDMPQVRQREAISALSRDDSREWPAMEKGRSVLPADNRGKRPVCIGFSEIDKYAVQIYQSHFPEHKNYGDIKAIDPTALPDFDLIVGGFPCQSFSIAGKRGGFEDTRGTLFFEIARIIKVKRPRLLLLENVKGLLNHDKGKTFATILQTLSDLDYDAQAMVLNSKNFGVPQNRERVFIVGHLRGTSRPEVFPLTRSGEEVMEQRSGIPQQTASTVTSLLHKLPRGMTTIEEPDMQIRRLTPTECERLQGFPDGWTQGVSDTQRYKTLGNAVTVNVIREIIKRMI